MRHGAWYGQGVYTATGPRDPLLFAHGTGTIILARALKGRCEHRESATADSWTPAEDCCVFKDGAQLLPLFLLMIRER
jgi:hypothetical protein